MDNQLNSENKPVCRFGPGGDFTSIWPPPQLVCNQSSINSLAKVLRSLSEIADTLLGLELNTALAVPADIQPAEELNLCQEEGLEYAVKNDRADRLAYTTATTIVESNNLFSDEPMLFADERRISIRAGHKPKYRIRTYCGTTKKKSAFILSRQSSLFDADFKNAKSA